MTKRLAVAAWCLGALVGPSHAISGNELLQKLDARDAGGLYYIIGSIEAISAAQAHLLQTARTKGDDRALELVRWWGCFPDGATNGQIVKVVQKYLQENPQNLHLNAQELISTATSRAWLCAQ